MSYSLLYNPDIPESIHVGLAKLQDINEAAGAELLDSDEREEFENISNQKRRREFLSTRQLVFGMAEKFGLTELGFKISKDAMGKPYAEVGGEHIYLSIAHCTGNVLCGISGEMDLGVDVEPIGREVHEGLGERIFHPNENKDVKELDLIRVWTIKEAMVKLEGKGLRTNLNELQVNRVNDTLFKGIFNNDKIARICSFDYDERWISIAFEPDEK